MTDSFFALCALTGAGTTFLACLGLYSQAKVIRALRDERTNLFTTIDTLHRRIAPFDRDGDGKPGGSRSLESVCVNPGNYPRTPKS